MTNLSKKSKEKLLIMAANLAKKSVSEPNLLGWPPDCIGLFYQNQRPKSLRNKGNQK